MEKSGKQITINIDPEIYEKIKEHCRKNHFILRYIVQDLIKNQLKEIKEKEREKTTPEKEKVAFL